MRRVLPLAIFSLLLSTPIYASTGVDEPQLPESTSPRLEVPAPAAPLEAETALRSPFQSRYLSGYEIPLVTKRFGIRWAPVREKSGAERRLYCRDVLFPRGHVCP